MLITCPSCGASYDVPEALVRGARKLRCARCRTQWSVSPDPNSAGAAATSAAPPRPAPVLASAETFGMTDDEELPPFGPDFNFDPKTPPRPVREASVAAEPAASNVVQHHRTEEDRRDRTMRLLVGLGWLGTVVVLLGLIWAGYHFRTGIAQAWPPSERLYAALGWRTAE
jgi:predicted Zn finger-like uncharacterized protein